MNRQFSGYRAHALVSVGFFIIAIIHGLTSSNIAWLWVGFAIFFALLALKAKLSDAKDRQQRQEESKKKV